MGNTDATSEPLPKLLTVPETARLLRVSRATCYRWIRAAQIPAIHAVGTVRVPARQLFRVLEAGRSGFRP